MLQLLFFQKMETLPYEIMNYISTFLEIEDHKSFITSSRTIHVACHDETKRKYATKMGVVYFSNSGDLEMLKYCHRINLPFSTQVMDCAATWGV